MLAPEQQLLIRAQRQNAAVDAAIHRITDLQKPWDHLENATVMKCAMTVSAIAMEIAAVLHSVHVICSK